MDPALDHEPTALLPSYGEHCTPSPNDRRRLWNQVSSHRNRPYADVTPAPQDVFVISSSSRLVRSGFPYQRALASAGVSSQNWFRLTADIAACVRQTSEDRLRIILSGLVTGGMLLFIIGPLSLLAGVASARSMDRAVERERLVQNANLGEPLNRILQEWNDAYFLPRNLLVRLEVPDGEEELAGQGSSNRSSKHRGYPKGSLRITIQQGVSVYWVEGLAKPRLVVTRVLL